MKTDLSFAEELALIGLAKRPAKGGTAGQLRSDFKAGFGNQKPDFTEALRSLAQQKLVEQVPRKKGQKSDYFVLLPSGRRELEERLGGAVSTASEVKKAARTLAAARSLGVSSAVATTLQKGDALLVWFLAQRLGETYRAGLSLKTLAARAAAEALGASGTKPQLLWQAMFQQAKSEPAEAVTLDLASFAAEVQRAARSAHEGWFGDRKLFIHHAWKAWQAETGAQLDLAAFKERLLASLRAGKLGLTRADFTATLDPADVAEAEIRDGTETFHFLTSDRDPTHS